MIIKIVIIVAFRILQGIASRSRCKGLQRVTGWSSCIALLDSYIFFIFRFYYPLETIIYIYAVSVALELMHFQAGTIAARLESKGFNASHQIGVVAEDTIQITIASLRALPHIFIDDSLYFFSAIIIEPFHCC